MSDNVYRAERFIAQAMVLLDIERSAMVARSDDRNITNTIAEVMELLAVSSAKLSESTAHMDERMAS